MLISLLAYVRRHHVALLALFVALGGVSYAAVKLPKNSVGRSQIKKNAVSRAKLAPRSVDSSKILNGSLTQEDFAANQLLVGPAGAEGPRGARGETGGTGPEGPPGPFPNVVPAGQTLYGSYASSGVAAIAGESHQVGESFTFRLPADPTTVAIRSNSSPTAECPGSVSDPQAAPGFLCVYEYVRENLADPGGLTLDFPGGGGSARTGFTVITTSAAKGFYLSRGTWAVTAG